ncbi:putative bifunctional diguanylate cyclase/phosphodiesterase [Pannonibacter tanglangensis]|uniref:EAL domain-containing protein n=1 Tax=Pannonibacter tanglangensis TaxID=2750084 RepID=A0ABW9ZFD7_9HYPH|nr:EAL domain-containing protein [Pannonibacter sp. XCT-34]NBN63563.1 EAL domain-containing protein [Pannonibacter sp. XCT-34]
MAVQDLNDDIVENYRAMDDLPHGVWVVDRSGCYIYQNRADREAFGDLRGSRPDQSWIPGDQACEWLRAHDRALAGETVRYTRKVATRQGLSYFDTTLVPVQQKGRIVAALGLAINNDPWVAAQREAEDARALLDDVIETIPDAIAAYDANDRLILFNAAYKKLYALSSPAIRIGARFEDILRYGLAAGQYLDAGETSEDHEEWLRRRLSAHLSPPPTALIQQLPNGRWLHVRERCSASGNIVGVRTDVTALKEAEAVIRRTAETDALTGLANRALMLDALNTVLRGQRTGDRSGALFMLDIDHFKTINDTLGHAAGDQVLRTMADRLRKALRAEDTIARLGGDEFAVLATGFAQEDACAVVARNLHRALTEEINIQGRLLRPGVSMGIALFPRDGMTATDLFKNADTALYRTKENGRNGWTLFNQDLGERLRRRAQMREDLADAMMLGTIGTAFQPVIDVRSGAHVGFEALARWTCNGTPVSPAEFVAVAEDAGMGLALGQAILDRTCAKLAGLIAEGLDPGFAAVNLETTQLKCTSFPDMLMETLGRFGLRPAHIELEITENTLLDRSIDQITRTLHDLRDLGFRFILDDFGTGYASLTHLKQFPVSGIKIDRSFIMNIQDGGQDAVIVRAMVELAHGLGMSVVAEGVETAEQYAFLRSIGCDLAQGYHICRPTMDPDAIHAWLARTPGPPG